MIAFLPHQGGFVQKMSPDSLDREHREDRTNTNVVKTDAYIKHFSNIFREGMMKRGEVDKLGVDTYEFDEDKWCIVFRILGPIYWPQLDVGQSPEKKRASKPKTKPSPKAASSQQRCCQDRKAHPAQVIEVFWAGANIKYVGERF